jgi:hypothetical protein
MKYFFIHNRLIFLSNHFISRRYQFAKQIDNALKYNTTLTPEAEAGAKAPGACPGEFYFIIDIIIKSVLILETHTLFIIVLIGPLNQSFNINS